MILWASALDLFVKVMVDMPDVNRFKVLEARLNLLPHGSPFHHVDSSSAFDASALGNPRTENIGRLI